MVEESSDGEGIGSNNTYIPGIGDVESVGGLVDEAGDDVGKEETDQWSFVDGVKYDWDC